MVRPYGSLPTPVTVATTARAWRSITHTVPLGGTSGARRGPPETTAKRPSEVTAVPLGRPGSTLPSDSAGRMTGMRATSARGSWARARPRSTIDTLFVRKFATMICRPSGVQETVNGRVWPLGSSVPTRTRAASAPGAPARARSTSMMEIHHGHVVRARVARKEVRLSVAAAAQGEKFGVGPATELRVGSFERNDRGRGRGNERNGEARAGVPRMPERHLDLSPAASGVPVDEADAVRAVLGQPVFRVAHEEQLGKDQEADRPEVAAVVIALDCAIGIVGSRIEHLPHVHDRDASAPAVLEELGVVHRSVMVDHVCRAAILAQHDVRGVAHGRAVEAVRVHLGSAHDGVRRVVVVSLQRSAEVDRVDPRVPAPGGEDETVVRERDVRGGEDGYREGGPRRKNDVFHDVVLLWRVTTGWDFCGRAATGAAKKSCARRASRVKRRRALRG